MLLARSTPTQGRKEPAWLYPALFVLLLAWVARTTILIRQRSGNVYDAVDGAAALQILLVAGCAALLATVGASRLRSLIRVHSVALWFVFVGIGAASLLWSVNPEFSAYRATEVAALSGAVFLIVAGGRNSPEQAERRMFLLASCCVLLLTLACLRRTGLTGGLRDNGLGAAAAMLASYSLVEWPWARGRRKRLLLVIGALSTFFVLASLSLASWLSLLFGLALLLFVGRHRMSAWSAVILLGGALILLPDDFTRKVILRDKPEQEVKGFHGRSALWESYVEASLARPWLGYGYACGARTVGAIYTTNCHNSFFGVLLGTGLLGFACVTVASTCWAQEALNNLGANRSMALGCTAALCAGGLNSMSLSYLGEQWMPSSVVFVALFSLHARLVEQRLGLGCWAWNRAQKSGIGSPAQPSASAIRFACRSTLFVPRTHSLTSAFAARKRTPPLR